MKFKVGDKVRIVKPLVEVEKKYIGNIVTISWVDPYDNERYRDKENNKYWRASELELALELIGEKITLKGIKKANGYYEIEMPKHNGYIWSYVANDKIFLQLNEEILDKQEKEYLRGLIRPFRDRVINIIKENDNNGEAFITITVKRFNDKDRKEAIMLPYFKKHTMYKGMELDKSYTLEELGL